MQLWRGYFAWKLKEHQFVFLRISVIGIGEEKFPQNRTKVRRKKQKKTKITTSFQGLKLTLSHTLLPLTNLSLSFSLIHFFSMLLNARKTRRISKKRRNGFSCCYSSSCCCRRRPCCCCFCSVCIPHSCLGWTHLGYHLSVYLAAQLNKWIRE